MKSLPAATIAIFSLAIVCIACLLVWQATDRQCDARDARDARGGGRRVAATGAAVANPPGPLVAGSTVSVGPDYVSVTQLGAVGDGVTDDSAAFVSVAKLGSNVYLPRGTYLVGNVTFTTSVQFSPGAVMIYHGGVWQFNGGFDANVELVFQGVPSWIPPAAAPIVVNQAIDTDGYVDWFGTDADAIEVCHKVFTVTHLQSTDYFVSRTVILNQSFRKIIGAYGSAGGLGGTRIVLTGPATGLSPVVQVGTLDQAVVANATRDIEISWINTVRGAPCQLWPTQATAPTGWLICGVYQGFLSHLYDFDSAISYKVQGTVGCTLDRLNCVNVASATGGTGNDWFTAFVLGGYTVGFGFVGSNASLLVNDCTCDGASARGDGTPTQGMLLYGCISDTWVKQFEMSQMNYGIVVDGADSTGVAIPGLWAHQDVIIDHPVLDGIKTTGMLIQNLNAGAMIEVTSPYVALPLAGSAIQVQSCMGAMRIAGGQMLSAAPTVAITGVNIISSNNVVVEGVLLKDFTYGMQCTNSSGIRATPVITRTTSPGGSAIILNNVARGYIAPIVSGTAGAWSYGVNANGVTLTEINLSGIVVSSLVGTSSAAKLTLNGTSDSMNATGSNIVTGVTG